MMVGMAAGCMMSQSQQLCANRPAVSDGLCRSRLACRAMPHCSQRQPLPARRHTASPNVRSPLHLPSSASRGQLFCVELSRFNGPGVRRQNAYRGREVRALSDEQQKQHGHSQQQPHTTERPEMLQRLLQESVAAMAAVAVTVTTMVGPMLVAPMAAQAVLNSPNAKIARSAEVALRRSIPAQNAYVRDVQQRLEGIQFKLRIPQRKPWGAISDDAASASATMDATEKVLEGLPDGSSDAGRAVIADVQEGLRRLRAVIAMQDPGKVSFRVADVLRDVAELELLQAPGLPYIIPRDYVNLPHLTGRAVVEMTIEKADGSLSYVTDAGGGPQAQAQLTLVVDGYSAPITGANFVRNVVDGVYCGAKLKVDRGAVLAGGGAVPGRTIPLEQLPLGQFDLVYKSPLDVRGGELPVLPLSIYGALAMSHAPDEGVDLGLAAADEFFIYKFDRQSSGLSGLDFSEGEFGVFGYVTKGQELIAQLSNGDVIKSARLVSGGDRLVNAPSYITEKALSNSVMFGLH
mmetsp:Transcript_17344/g.51914  ORF Transcript_17344/g.51914 Transcript_17344/m.51914 type:complete len:518 (-) Transcript_17344:3244-4797(-)